MKHLFLICTIGFLISGCSSARIKYVGSIYPSTTNVDIYYSEKDVPKEYVTMGHAEALEGLFPVKSITDEALKGLTKEAQKRGADGIIIEGIRTSITSGKSSTENTNVYASFIKYK